VVVNWENDLGTWSNVLWFSQSDFDGDDLQWLATITKVSLVDNLVDLCAVTTLINSVEAYDMRSIDGEIKLGVYGGGTGDGTGGPLPLNNCVVSTLYTGVRGRAHRGRVYWAGFSEDALVDGIFSGTLLGQINGVCNTLRVDVLGYGWVWGVHSSQLDGVPRNPQVVTPITTTTVRSNTPGSQRRRLRRG
jgi:hypothetical protein